MYIENKKYVLLIVSELWPHCGYLWIAPRILCSIYISFFFHLQRIKNSAKSVKREMSEVRRDSVKQVKDSNL